MPPLCLAYSPPNLLTPLDAFRISQAKETVYLTTLEQVPAQSLEAVEVRNQVVPDEPQDERRLRRMIFLSVSTPPCTIVQLNRRCGCHAPLRIRDGFLPYPP